MWSKQDELNFFNDAINISSIENLMMRVRGRYYAFQPKTDNSRVNVPNSRNALIGTNTEKWCKDLFSQIARHNNLYAVNGVVCEEIGLSRQSAADLAFCTSASTNRIIKAKRRRFGFLHICQHHPKTREYQIDF